MSRSPLCFHLIAGASVELLRAVAEPWMKGFLTGRRARGSRSESTRPVQDPIAASMTTYAPIAQLTGRLRKSGHARPSDVKARAAATVSR
jgi:hypothetical protein